MSGLLLRRFLAPAPPAPPAPEVCELCGAVLREDHRHMADAEKRALACVCTACALLFDRPGAGEGRFRTVPDRILSDDRTAPDAEAWAALGIPVGVAFFFRHSALDRPVGLYPSPAGATESDLDPAAWERALGGSPLARMMTPDVEALLVRRREQDGGTQCFLVPVDMAYELVGRLRLHWQGFDGGPRARAEIAAFFDRLERRSTPAPRTNGRP
jgi:hypothetical protein